MYNDICCFCCLVSFILLIMANGIPGHFSLLHSPLMFLKWGWLDSWLEEWLCVTETSWISASVPSNSDWFGNAHLPQISKLGMLRATPGFCLFYEGLEKTNKQISFSQDLNLRDYCLKLWAAIVLSNVTTDWCKHRTKR